MNRRPDLRESKPKSESATVGIVASKVERRVACMKARRRAVRRRGLERQ